MSSNDLRLSEPLASEWTLFITALKGAGISLKAEPDVLLWAGGDGSGKITAKNLYFLPSKNSLSLVLFCLGVTNSGSFRCH
jgi:hypothetical protein